MESFTLLGKVCSGIMLSNRISLKIAILRVCIRERVAQVSLKSIKAC